MQDKRKIRLIIGLIVVIVTVFFGGLSMLVFNFLRSDTSDNEVITQIETSYTEVTSPTSQSSTEASKESDPSSVYKKTRETQTSHSEIGEVEDVLKIRNFLSVYYTWELEKDSVSDRAELLKELMSESLYEEKNIANDSEILKEMIDSFNETSEINTSNSMQLLSSQYLSSQIYQDTEDLTLYRITVRIAQKAPYQDTPFITGASIHMRLVEDEVTQMSDPIEQARIDEERTDIDESE